jgi:hypothetical protein
MNLRRLAILCIIVALPAAGVCASELTAEVGSSTRAGDVIRVHGEGAFARGTRVSFFVGDVYASWRRLDDRTAVVVVPARVAAGERWLSAARDLTTDASRATGIVRLHVEPEASTTIAAATAALPSARTSDVTAGILRVTSRAVRGPARITLRQVRSDTDTAFFRSTLIAGLDRADPPLPALSFEDVFIVTSDAAAELSAMQIELPAEWLASVPDGYEPELFSYAEESGANDELIPGVEALEATWTAATRRLTVRPRPPLRITSDRELTLYVALRTAKESEK